MFKTVCILAIAILVLSSCQNQKIGRICHNIPALSSCYEQLTTGTARLRHSSQEEEEISSSRKSQAALLPAYAWDSKMVLW